MEPGIRPRTQGQRGGRSDTWRWIAALLVLVLAAGCADGGGDAATDLDAADEATGETFSSTRGGSIGRQDVVDSDDAAEPEATDDAAGPVAQQVGGQAGRHVVRTAELVLEVRDSAQAADDVVRIAEGAGGFVAEADLERDDQNVVRGTLTLRVPSERLLATVDELDALAEAAPVRRIDEVDVTGEVTDLRAQVRNLTAYETELRELLSDVRDSSNGADELLRVFERIREVRGEIDRAEARLASLEDRVALSTIRVTLRPTATALPVTDPTWNPAETIRDALADTARALTVVADVAIRFVLTGVPMLLLLAVPVALLWRFASSRQRRDTDGPPPAEPAATGTGASDA